MRAEKVEVSWDADQKQWVVRIQVGEEVLRRKAKLAKDAGDADLQSSAIQIAKDEGYEVDAAGVTVRR